MKIDNKPIYKMSIFYDNTYKANKCDLVIQRNRVVRYIFSQNMAFDLRLKKGGWTMKGNNRKC